MIEFLVVISLFVVSLVVFTVGVGTLVKHKNRHFDNNTLSPIIPNEISEHVSNALDSYHKSNSYHPKDLNDPSIFKDGKQYIEKKDLVLVHRTNYFPKDGEIKTRLYDNPDLLRDTIHFSLNGPVRGHIYGNWDNSKYTIIVPLDHVDDNTLENMILFNPSDTVFMGDFKLPEGSVIIGTHDSLKDKDGKAGNAKIKETHVNDLDLPSSDVDYDPKTYVPKKSLLNEIKDMGYFPMEIGTWNWDCWGPDTVEILDDSAKHMGLYAKTHSHGNDWTTNVEDVSMSKADKLDVYNHTKEYVSDLMQDCEERVKRPLDFLSKELSKHEKELKDIEQKTPDEYVKDVLRVDKYGNLEDKSSQEYFLENKDSIYHSKIGDIKEKIESVKTMIDVDKKNYEQFLKYKDRFVEKMQKSIVRSRAKKSLENFPEGLQRDQNEKNKWAWPKPVKKSRK